MKAIESQGGVRAESMLEDKILIYSFIQSCLLPPSGLCWGQLGSELRREESFGEPRLGNDRGHFP